MSANGDGLRPAWNKPGNVLADDRLTEDGAAQDVPDGSIRALPHLLQAELCTLKTKTLCYNKITTVQVTRVEDLNSIFNNLAVL